MDPKGLFNLFNNFGIVKDAFIPKKKRRKTTQSRFGFVRYDCVVAAQIAIQKANGIWCEDRSLIFKKAEFDNTQEKAVKEQMPHRPRALMMANGSKRMGNRSYAEVVKCEGNNKTDVVIKAIEVGNGWLYQSIIVKLKAYCSFTEFRKEFWGRNLKNIQLRKGGDREAIVTFNSIDDMKNKSHILGD
ncbi:hypothetical protein ACSBR2_032023 [Camellia fascicularis]